MLVINLLQNQRTNKYQQSSVFPGICPGNLFFLSPKDSDLRNCSQSSSRFAIELLRSFWEFKWSITATNTALSLAKVFARRKLRGRETGALSLQNDLINNRFTSSVVESARRHNGNSRRESWSSPAEPLNPKLNHWHVQLGDTPIKLRHIYYLYI